MNSPFGDLIVGVVILLVGGVVVFGPMVGIAMWLDKSSCASTASMMRVDHQWAPLGGCIVKVNDRWVPLGAVREINP